MFKSTDLHGSPSNRFFTKFEVHGSPQVNTKEFLGKIVDSATPGPIKIMRGDLIGAAFTGGTSGTGGTVRQNQLMFDWEADPNAANIPQAQPGGLFKIQPRLTRRAKRQVQRPGVVFQKPVSLDITNGFKSSRKHRNFDIKHNLHIFLRELSRGLLNTVG